MLGLALPKEMSPESGFLLNIDLSLYFDDLRKYSSVFVDSTKCKVVGDIEKHIKTLFSLEDDICLVNDKFLIPKFEDIRIVQHCPILRVRKCNFFDEQIHKNNPPKRSCEQTAVNLIQPEKTIDLSCRPKQRLKLGYCSSTPKANGCSTDSKKRRSKIEAGDSEIEENPPNDQHKKKKRKNANDSEDNPNDIGIIDMSCSKKKKKSHDNCFMTSEDLSGDIDEQLGTDEQQVSEVIQKSKKRKNRRLYENGNKDQPCNFKIPSDSKHKNSNLSEKNKIQLETDYIEESDNGTDLVVRHQFTSTVSEDEHLPSNGKKTKNKSFGHKRDANKINIENSYNSNSHDEGKEFLSLEETHKDFERDNVFKSSSDDLTHKIENLKKACQERIVSMLKKSHTNESCNLSERNHEVSMDGHEPITENDQISQMSNEDQSVTEEHSEQSNVNSYVKPKRKRKHAKKKKRESQYLSAVGPILNDIVLSNKLLQPSPTASEIAKHMYFTEEDFAEEMPIPPTPKTENAKQTDFDTFKTIKIFPSQSCKTGHETAPATWQQTLLDLATSSSKPVVFHRNHHSILPAEKAVLSTNKNADISLKSNPEMNQIKSEQPKFELTSVEELPEEKSENETLKTSKQEITKEASCDYKGITVDVDSIDVNKYPIIKKVIDGDIIIFKILKLNEKFEPEVSKTVLAKVIDSQRFPDTITFDVIGGCDYKDAMKCNKGLIIELQWMDLIEPRLFYP